MSYSPLVSYVRLSPNKSSRNGSKIDTISIHCMAGNLSVETCGALFASSNRKASSNYGIDSNGNIGCYVEEEYRSWCTSSRANDRRAITIEVANTVAADPWPVSDAAYEALIRLLADVCKRNNIKKLLWKADKSLIGQVNLQNMTVHRWFAKKACPGNYLYNHHADIANRVNALLKGKEEKVTETEYFAVGKVTAKTGLNVRKGASVTFDKVKTLPFDSVVNVTAKTSNGWYKINEGYVSSDYIEITEEDDMDDKKFAEYMNRWIVEQAKKDPSEWSKESREFCEKNGIIAGDGKGNFMYKNFITREEAVVMIHRACMFIINTIKKVASK